MKNDKIPRRTSEELEQIFRGPLVDTALRGTFRGTFHGFFENEGTRHLHVRLLDTALFVLPPFGMDFDRERWWFGTPAATVGRFRLEPGPSRWRDAEVLQVHYDRSRLPGPVRRYLYDELKPLGPDHAIGIGGVNEGRGHGDHFFFELTR
jgi:hypothetical protein